MEEFGKTFDSLFLFFDLWSASVIQATPLSVPPVWLLAGKPLLNVENETALVAVCVSVPPPRLREKQLHKQALVIAALPSPAVVPEFLSLSFQLVFPLNSFLAPPPPM